MITLPIPLISSLMLTFLMLTYWMQNKRFGFLSLLLSVCAIQGVIISLAQHYHITGALSIQPITACLIPALAWVAFYTTAVRKFKLLDYIHTLGPIAAIIMRVSTPYLLDVLIPALFTGYGLAILIHALKGSDAMPRMRLEVGDLPSRIWAIIGISLMFSAASDLLIVITQINNLPHWKPWIISLYSSMTILSIGGLSLSGALQNADKSDATEPTPEITEQDRDIVSRLNELMQTQKIYLNPDLTLSQISRKMLVPVKQLSSAVNRVTSQNISRHINAARIHTAQQALKSGETVTNAMLSSGFNTKSNFNREFLRITNKSPTDWAREHV